MPVQNLSPLLSTDVVATYLGIRPRTVLAWVQQGRLPQPIRIGKAPLWESADILLVVDAARARKDEIVKEAITSTRASTDSFLGKSSSKELQMMLALRRAQLGNSRAGGVAVRRPH